MADATRRLVRVNPRGTTRTCNKCGHLNDKLPLSQRAFLCAACGHTDDRDVNAAKNILGRGMALRVTAEVQEWEHSKVNMKRWVVKKQGSYQCR